MLPIKYKPEFDLKHGDLIKVIPNVLNIDQINHLRNYALTDTSGLHRRGSKDKNTKASFNTCQLHPLNDEIYNILAPFWDPYTNLTFIEPYEIKEYVQGDLFGYHTDAYVNLYENVDRKMNLIVQLSDEREYEGGDLIVGEYLCSKKQGTCIMFPASIFHKVTEIISGTRYSLIGHGWGPYYI